MMRTGTDLLEHAAALLDGEALCLRSSHNINAGNPTWKGEPEVKAEHDDMKDTSTALYAMAEQLPLTETVTWHSVSSPPDSDTTVQLFDKDASEPVWPGYLDGDMWRYADGMPAKPTLWAEMCRGPKT
jgi:hypothetical protein